MRGRDVAGRKAIVTGAASGIGAAAVARLIADGVSVLAVDIVADGLGGTHNLVADLGDEHAFAQIANEAELKLGGLDILINNAGVCPAGPFDEMTMEQPANPRRYRGGHGAQHPRTARPVGR